MLEVVSRLHKLKTPLNNECRSGKQDLEFMNEQSSMAQTARTMQTKRSHYDAIDGLRTIACIGIVMMHIKENNTYEISGFLYNSIIASFTNFVFLFMVISAFGMCCGYFEKMLNNQISLESFYVKRYRKILPFFALLVLLDVVISPSKKALIEGIADITLLFGLFPNNISVIGVGWFLGLIFADRKSVV